MKKIVILSRKGIFIFIIVVGILMSTYALNLRDTYNRLQHGVPRGVYLGEILMEKKLEWEVRAIVEQESMLFFKRPRNAYFDRLTGHLVKEIYGEKVDVQATVAMIMDGDPDRVYSPVMVTLEPEITVDVYRDITERLGSFGTGYGGGGGRGENIRLAASFIHNYLLAPGETFSFNKVTGHNIPGKGYKPAPIIVGNNVIPGYGGGVCQVSSTLYNAVLFSKLEIVERFPHSRPIGYVPMGRDATVSGHLDFKFRNNTNKFILIKGGGGGGYVYFEIWSSPKESAS
jgi:vancomycin resistance protein YoaR